MSDFFTSRWTVYRKEVMRNGRWHRVWDFELEQEAVSSVIKECENALEEGLEMPVMRVVQIKVTEVELNTCFDTRSPDEEGYHERGVLRCCQSDAR